MGVERRSGKEASCSSSGAIEVVQAKHEAAMNLEERVNPIGNDIEEPRLASRSICSTNPVNTRRKTRTCGRESKFLKK
jgi:hypothetical protein